MYDSGEDTKYYMYNSKHDVFKPNITDSFWRTHDYYDKSIEPMRYHINRSECSSNNTRIIKDFNCRNDIALFNDYNYLKESLISKYDSIGLTPEMSSHNHGNTKCLFPNKQLYEYFE